MKDKIKKLITEHSISVAGSTSIVRHDELAEDISSNYISKDKVMEIAEFSMGYGFTLGKGFSLDGMHEIGKNETLIKFKDNLKKTYGL